MSRVIYHYLNPRRFERYAIYCRSSEASAAAYKFVVPRHGMEGIVCE